MNMINFQNRYVSQFLYACIICFLALDATILCAQVEGPYIPLEKGLNEDWVKTLYEKGEQKIYSGKELNQVAMPCGGIGAGQVEVTGDGQILFTESVYNQLQQANAGLGYANGGQYLNPQPRSSKIENNFSLVIKEEGAAANVYELNGKDFDDIEFIGEYPIAKLNYKSKENKLPVKISSEIFSPFVPLDLRKSANPVTILKYTITNTDNKTVEVSLAGRLKSHQLPDSLNVTYANTVKKSKGVTAISLATLPKTGEMKLGKMAELGEISLSVLDHKASVTLRSESLVEFSNGLRSNSKSENNSKEIADLNEPIAGGVQTSFQLKPNETREVTFMLSWYFPNLYGNAYDTKGWVGHLYNNWYSNSFEVAEYVAKNYKNLYEETILFRNTYNDNTLPYWLANRLTMPLSTLASGNVAVWKNGRMYAYEGIGFCTGTCGHVYNFVTAISKLFPELERSVRIEQDFNDSIGLAKSGRVNFRGHDPNDLTAHHSYASDAQSGYILKAYREHLMSADNTFLDAVWDKLKRVIGYQIFKDGAEVGLPPNGVLECRQTFWDPMWYGPNPYNNTLYLAALRAAEEMAKIKGETELAARYHSIFEEGREFMDSKMWNGEYYIHLYPSGFAPHIRADNGHRKTEEIENNAIGYITAFNSNEQNYQTGTSCDAQQLFGQNWANQLGLGYILSPEHCEVAGKSIFKYNWTPDIATVYDYKKPKARILAASGEGAMVNGSWPKESPKDYENTHDKSDIWTGLEYEASCDMINEGLLKEAFVILRSIQDRYDGSKRNPWNEIEGSDHYSRAMHSWNVLLSLSGYTYDGPAGILGFDPKFNQENFKSFFSGAEGWGTIGQEKNGQKQYQTITVTWGNLRLNQLKFESQKRDRSPKAKVSVNGKVIRSSVEISDGQLHISLDEEQIIRKGQQLIVEIS